MLVGVIGIVVMLVLIFLRMPVGFVMAIVGLAGFSYLTTPEAGFSVLAKDFFSNFSSYTLTVIPLFVLMGAFASVSGMSQRLYKSSYTLVGHLRGGLAMATIVACAGFAAICGSTNATSAVMGKVSLPEMKRYHYDDSLATGSVASAGVLGILIPPSTIFIIYGVLTQQSIGKLFMAGVIPGILLTGLFMGTVAWLCWRNPKLAPVGEKTTFKQKVRSLTGLLEMLILFAIVVIGLFLGWFSPTAAAGIGAAAALVIGLVRRQVKWPAFKESILDTLRISCMIMVIVAGAMVFGHFLAVTRIPMELSGWISGLAIPPAAVMGIIIFMYLVFGCIMDALALIMLTIPIIYPVVIGLGYDPIWFGVIIVLVTAMGVITPPVGINVYVVKGIAPKVPLYTIFRGIWPFLIAIIILTIILVFVPQIATFLPDIVSY
jgi:C4-dicarboxylate transporter DctM subunit